TRLVYFLHSVITDLPLSLLTWSRVGSCKSLFKLFFCVIPDLCPFRAKYPLAVVEKMLDVFGRDLGGGFDIGCRFETTLYNSLLGPHARELNHTSLVGSFHGHAHRHLCQLRHLATYIKGLGLEDLEGCERAFSK